MAKPGTINRTRAVEVNIQAVVPVSTTCGSAAQAKDGKRKVRKNKKMPLADVNFIQSSSWVTGYGIVVVVRKSAKAVVTVNFVLYALVVPEVSGILIS